MVISLRWFCACAILVLSALPVAAQCVPPDTGVDEAEAILAVINSLAEPDTQIVSEAVEATPSSAPRGVQLTASPANGSTSALAANVEGPSVLGLALESGVVSQEEGKITIGTSLFGVRMLFDPQLWYDQTAYQKAENSRRFNFKVTFGGEGEKFDRDGDGKEDEPLEAKELGDITAWEIQYRLGKSRDRREKYNWDQFRTAVPAGFRSSQTAWRHFLRQLLLDSGYPAIVNQVRNNCWKPNDVTSLKNFVADSSRKDTFMGLARQLAAADAAVMASLKAAADEVDKTPLFSMAAGGIERKDEFGNDVIYLALRGDRAFTAGNLKLNIEWKKIDTAAGDEPTTVIGTLEGTKLLFKGAGTKRDIEGSFAASFERFRDVPNVDDGTNAKASLKLVLPIAEGLSLPLSVTWANHKDLLDDNDEVVGHFGLAFDMSKILKLPILGGG